MAPSNSRNGAAGETPMRQSCDRCHSQKLRCTVASVSSNKGACGRCLAKRVQCIYSFALPKGRPSVYNLADKSTGSGTGNEGRNGSENGNEIGNNNGNKNGAMVGVGGANTTGSAAGVTASSTRRLPSTIFAPSTLVAASAGSKTRSAEDHAGFSTSADANAHSRHHIMNDERIFPHKIGDTATDISTEPWPWSESLTWDDFGDLTEVPTDWSSPNSSESMFNWHGIKDSSPTSATVLDPDRTACLAGFPGLMDWASTGNGNDVIADGNETTPVQDLPRPHSHKHSYSHGLRTSHSKERSNSSTSGSNDGGIVGSNSNINDPDIVIAQLSQLSMRLSRLRQSFSSYPPNDNNQDNQHQKPLIDDATVESVAAWLVHGSSNRNMLFPAQKYDDAPHMSETKTTGNLLYLLFSSSQDLLQILSYMQGNTRGANTPSLSNSINSTPSSVGSIEPTYFALNTGSESSRYSSPPNHYPNNVIRHLLIACHTMLSNIYVSVLKILEYDTNPIDHGGATALGDIGLVSIVQLCSYLTIRQYQAIDMYLSAQSSPVTSPWQERTASDQGLQLYPDAATGEEMRNLRIEVQQRLARLQQTLCF